MFRILELLLIPLVKLPEIRVGIYKKAFSDLAINQVAYCPVSSVKVKRGRGQIFLGFHEGVGGKKPKKRPVLKT